MPNSQPQHPEEIKKAVTERAQNEQREFGSANPSGKEPITDRFYEQCFWEDQDGDADLFRRIFEGRLVYDYREDAWYRFEDHSWRRLYGEQVLSCTRDLVKEWTRAMWRYQKRRQETSDGDECDRLEKWEKRFKSRADSLKKITRKRSIISLAKTMDDFLFHGEWDQVPLRFACANGVINLETFELEPGRPQDYIRTASPAEYDPDAKCDTWEQFLLEIFDGDVETIEYIQKVFGYSITGLANINRFHLFYGEHGQNGKGTMLETLFQVLGDYASPIQSEMLLDRGVPKNPDAPSASLYDLYGKRVIWGSETEENRRFSAAAVKFLAGGDTVWCRAPHAKEPIKFPPTHSLFLLTNHRPGISAKETAFWSRCRVVPFNLSFVENPRQSFERPYNPKLKLELTQELPGILRWIVDGCQKWQADGHLEWSQAVKEATTGYRDEVDICLKFFREVCIENEQSRIQSSDLYTAFKVWALESGVQQKRYLWSSNKWGREMTAFVQRTPGISKTDSKKSSVVHYLGFTVTEDYWKAVHDE
ncbi:DNA primase family protein [Desulfovibrio oxyclinae]|jgi:putative DNA primase/helicase|uniref:DNA primase family protein n=1 Tax=Desulfovibrio oxyclinae TaxID=63560 RepID=UPI000361AB7F|nr:DNA primase family protein [Desulfovibrio oxyclinae]